jgi:SAM-dependent methyltransferase
MRAFWDERARENAAWFVDTSLSYDHPDMERFFATGKRIADLLFADAPIKPAGRELAVDIGSGLGRICLALSEHFREVVGIDISSEMVDRARQLVTEPRVRFEVGNGASLRPVEDGTADLVVSFTVFQHIPRVEVIEAYLAEAGRVLRPGGVLAFQWNNQPGARWWAARRRLLSTLQRTGLRPERYGRNAAEFLGSRVPLSRIERALGRAGLRLHEVRDPGTLFTWAWAEKA